MSETVHHSVADEAPDPVVVVTGAGGQIGAAIVARLAARGARLLLVDRDEGTLGRTLADLPVTATAESLALDLTDGSSGQRVLEHAVTRYGRVDALVNNAGVEGPLGLLDKVADADVALVFQVNVLALIRISAAFGSYFRGRRAGRIVNLASGSGLNGTGMMAPYSASKHAVVGLTRSMAQELGPDGVAVNAVCPGCVASPMMARIESRLAELRGTAEPVSFVGSIPMGRYCEPAEVAEVVRWLALEAPLYLTGTTVVLDGGMRS